MIELMIGGSVDESISIFFFLHQHKMQSYAKLS